MPTLGTKDWLVWGVVALTRVGCSGELRRGPVDVGTE